METQKQEQSLIEELFTVLSENEDRSSERGSRRRGFPLNASGSGYQLKKFIDEIPGGFLIYAAEGDERILYANKALLRIFRCNTMEQFREHVGNSFRGIVHPQDLDRVEKAIWEQVHGTDDNTDYVEYRVVGKDGVTRWVEDYGHFVHSESMGDVFYVFITDATEKVCRRIAEKAELIQEKREKEHKLKTLTEEYDKERKLIRQEHLQRLEVIEGLSVNYDSILYADLENDSVLPYRLSERLERQFKKKLEARSYRWFINDYVKRWVYPADCELVVERISPEYMCKKLAEVSTYYLNYRTLFNGETQYIQLRFVNVGGGEKVSQVVIGCRNVDVEVLQEHKQKRFLEEALKAAKLADVAKNTFLSNMSHDMRTPLNALFGYTGLARKSAEDPQAVRGYLDKIDRAGRQILELIEKVLEISYTESQEFRIAETDCNLGNVLRETYSAALPQAAEKSISFILDNDSLRHENVVCDGEKLKQLLLHLVHNAVQYTKNGGSVTLSVTENEKRDNGFCDYEFAVRDTGIGIRKENLQRIFEPFERESNTTFSGEYGTGLGLTIARRLAETMGGEIRVESTVGEGSVFTVKASFLVRSGEKGTADPAPEVSFQNKKVLIVEDNEINLEIETDILTDLGFLVDTAENGRIAVDKLSSAAPGEYAFVIMDIQMPVMDGRAAARAIRALPDPRIARVPIIALSANAFESDKLASLESGMDAHLTKPIDVPLLLETVRKLLK